MNNFSVKNAVWRLIFVVLGVPLAVAFALCLKLFLWDIPRLSTSDPRTTAFMALHGGEIRQTWVPLARISRHLARAVVAAEDSRFYDHEGVDTVELENSWKRNLKDGGYARGGSTIPMQLAKNLFLMPNKNVFRKGLEILIALKMNRDLTKERILEIYLNVVEWGDGIYGAEAAAWHYFKKPAAALTPYESAYLAAILPSPVAWGKQPPGPYVRRRAQTLMSRLTTVPGPDLRKLASSSSLQKETAPSPDSKAAARKAPMPVKGTGVSTMPKPQIPPPPAHAPEPVVTPDAPVENPPEATEPVEDTGPFFLDDV